MVDETMINAKATNTILKIILIFIAINVTTSDHGVQFLLTGNPDQLITSSTLKWISAKNGKKPVNAVIGFTRHLSFNESNETDSNVYICRAMHDAEWIPGQLLTEEKACSISLLGLVKSYDHYEVLQNVDNGSRLIWTDWDTYHTFPSGIVAGGTNLYIARKNLEELQNEDAIKNKNNLKGFSHYVGKFNSKDAFGSITLLTEEKKEQKFTKGQLLVELEPIKYEINNITYATSRMKIKKKKKLLAFVTLRNDGEKKLEVESVLAYDDFHSSYWGQGSAMLNGLTTVIRNTTAGKIIAEIKWGVEDNENRKKFYKIKSVLQPGTASNVSLWGNETISEVSYKGTLLSFYKDKTITSRNIYGSRRVIQISDVKPEFEPAFFVQNNSFISMTTNLNELNATHPITKYSNDIEFKVETKTHSTIFPFFAKNKPNEVWSEGETLSLKNNQTLPRTLLAKNEEKNIGIRVKYSQLLFLSLFSSTLFKGNFVFL